MAIGIRGMERSHHFGFPGAQDEVHGLNAICSNSCLLMSLGSGPTQILGSLSPLSPRGPYRYKVAYCKD